MAELLWVIAGQAQQQSEMLAAMRTQQERHLREMVDIRQEVNARQEAKAQQESLQNEVKELKALIADGLRRAEPL